MNGLAPPKKVPGELGSKAGQRKLIASTYYGALTLIANVFGSVFWFVEQRRWRVADWLDNEDLEP
jgi:hypothetical protein